MLQANVDLRKLDKAIRRCVRAGADLRPVWRATRSEVRKEQAEHVKRQEGPKGKWPALSSATLNRRLRAGGINKKFTKRGNRLKKRAARRLGKMLSRKLIVGSKYKIHKLHARMTSPVPWAGVHNKGGQAGRPRVRIPARQFMWVSRKLQNKVARVAATHLAQHFERG